MKILNNSIFWMVLSLVVFAIVITLRAIGNVSILNYVTTCFAGLASGLWIDEVMNEKRN